MSREKIPQIDSIQELARFWDTHDVADFEDQLEEVTEAVFEREAVVSIHLPLKEAESIRSMARSKGVDSVDLIRQWILERLQAPQSR